MPCIHGRLGLTNYFDIIFSFTQIKPQQFLVILCMFWFNKYYLRDRIVSTSVDFIHILIQLHLYKHCFFSSNKQNNTLK